MNEYFYTLPWLLVFQYKGAQVEFKHQNITLCYDVHVVIILLLV